MEALFILVYLILGYWAVGETVWANRIIVGTNIFRYRIAIAFVFGWVLIPVALLKKLVFS